MAAHQILKDELVAGPFKTIGGYMIGQIVKYPDGYRFLPAISSHKPSRKAWPTAYECVPAWAWRATGNY